MLQILECRDFTPYKKQLDMLDGFDGELHIVESVGDNSVDGFAIYAVNPQRVTFYFAEAGDDLGLFDGIIRAVIFKAVIASVDMAFFERTVDGERLMRLGFIQNDGRELNNLADFMNNCKNCRNSKE